MKSRVELNNQTAFSIDEEVVFGVVEKVIIEEGGDKNRLISVAFISSEDMRLANKQCKGKDYATDVLSFYYNEEDVLGEVVLCPEKIMEQSREQEESFEKEILRMIVHGILHLFGYTHDDDKKEQEMNERTEFLLREV